MGRIIRVARVAFEQAQQSAPGKEAVLSPKHRKQALPIPQLTVFAMSVVAFMSLALGVRDSPTELGLQDIHGIYPCVSVKIGLRRDRFGGSPELW
jgi:hypothetical protein